MKINLFGKPDKQKESGGQNNKTHIKKNLPADSSMAAEWSLDFFTFCFLFFCFFFCQSSAPRSVDE